MIEQHFVTFFSPGTFVAEQSTYPIPVWDAAFACWLADAIHERHGASPYGFQFTTRTRGAADLDSHVSATSPLHYLGGRIETVEEVEARHDSRESILLSNMKCNGWDKIVVNENSYRWTQPLNAGDILLDYVPPSKRAVA